MDQYPVSLSEAARQIGVDKSTISRQLAAGIYRNHGTPDRPLVDVAEVRQTRDRGLDRSKQRGPESPLFGPTSAIEPVQHPRAEEDDEPFDNRSGASAPSPSVTDRRRPAAGADRAPEKVLNLVEEISAWESRY